MCTVRIGDSAQVDKGTPCVKGGGGVVQCTGSNKLLSIDQRDKI